jgi:hypothetical protein
MTGNHSKQTQMNEVPTFDSASHMVVSGAKNDRRPQHADPSQQLFPHLTVRHIYGF